MQSTRRAVLRVSTGLVVLTSLLPSPRTSPRCLKLLRLHPPLVIWVGVVVSPLRQPPPRNLLVHPAGAVVSPTMLPPLPSLCLLFIIVIVSSLSCNLFRTFRSGADFIIFWITGYKSPRTRMSSRPFSQA